MRLSLITLTLITLAMLFMIGCKKDSVVSDKSVVAEIVFLEPVAYDVLIADIQSQGLEAVEYKHQFVVQGDTFTGGTTKKLTSEEELKDHVGTFLNEYNRNIELINKQGRDELEFVSESEIENILTTPSTVYITAVEVYGSINDINNLAGEFNGAEVFIKEQPVPVSQDNILNKTDGGGWLPSVGYVTCTEVTDDPEERYVFNAFMWNYLPTFDEEATYEHDFFLNSYNDGEYPDTYLSEDQTISGKPEVTYWTSNLPTTYLDTRFEDDADAETAYTIGCPKAISIHNDKAYYTYIQIDKGEDDTDSFKLQGQLGHRFPAWCPTTFCSFSDEITNIVPAWQPIPTLTYYWTM